MPARGTDNVLESEYALVKDRPASGGGAGQPVLGAAAASSWHRRLADVDVVWPGQELNLQARRRQGLSLGWLPFHHRAD